MSTYRINGKWAYLTAMGMALSALSATQAQADDGWFKQAEAANGHQSFNNYCAQCDSPSSPVRLVPRWWDSRFSLSGVTNR